MTQWKPKSHYVGSFVESGVWGTEGSSLGIQHCHLCPVLHCLSTRGEVETVQENKGKGDMNQLFVGLVYIYLLELNSVDFVGNIWLNCQNCAWNSITMATWNGFLQYLQNCKDKFV